MGFAPREVASRRVSGACVFCVRARSGVCVFSLSLCQRERERDHATGMVRTERVREYVVDKVVNDASSSSCVLFIYE